MKITKPTQVIRIPEVDVKFGVEVVVETGSVEVSVVELSELVSIVVAVVSVVALIVKVTEEVPIFPASSTP